MAEERDLVLTIGTFDGVHLGHRYLVKQVVRCAEERGWLSGAITFHPHPQVIVTGQGPPPLCTLDERLALLRGLGLDVVVALPFTQDMARLSALDLMSILCQSRRLREVWVGRDFALGYRREGTVTRLAEIGHDLGYRVHGLAPLVVQGNIVSSTLIRWLVAKGEVEEAARLLARPHHVSGIAKRGSARGCEPGFPAATVAVSDGLAVPASGVYEARVRSGDRQWSATVHMEPNPAGMEQGQEVSVPDFPDDLYGQSLGVEFVRRLSPDVPAQSLRHLKEKVLAQGYPRPGRCSTKDETYLECANVSYQLNNEES